MKKKVVPIIVGIIIFGIGFFAGMEFKAFQIRTALQSAFSGFGTSNTSPTGTTMMQQAKEEKMQIIEKVVGDEVILATMNLKVTSVEETQILNSKYGSPKVAKDGTKFVVIGLDITNTTKSAFDFSTDLVLVDNTDREFSTYSDSIGAIDKYLDYRSLSPSVKESGYLIYEIPTDATGYSLTIGKAGTNELYKIVLK
jgi:hypothetical protein